MQWLTFIVFCVGAATLAVSANSDNYMEKVLLKSNKILVDYNQNLDDVVPFKELRASLEVLDVMARDYQGESRSAIYEATNLGYKATDKYYQATDTVLAWCVKADTIINYIIKYEPGNSKAFKALQKMMGQGVVAIEKSLTKLEDVRSDLTQMGRHLAPVPGSLTKELQQLRENYLAKNLFTRVVGIIIKLIQSAINFLAHLLNHIPLSIEEIMKSDEEKFKVTEQFYERLIKAVQYAQGNVTAVREALIVEIKEVRALHGGVDGHFELIETFGELPVEQLNTMSKTVKAFITKHYGSYTNNVRRRREIVNDYHGLDVDRLSRSVDRFMNATAAEREATFWTMNFLPQNENHFLGDLSKFSSL